MDGDRVQSIRQVDRFRASVDALRRGEPVPEDGYHGDYVRELAAQDGARLEPALLNTQLEIPARRRLASS